MNARFVRRILPLIGTTWSISMVAAIHYVDVNSTNAVAPYTNWATAATIIQDAIDLALPGDEIVVSNGIYQTGGRAGYPGAGMTNRVAVTKRLTVRSVNGAAATIIRGRPMPDPIRGVYLTNQAVLAGFTIVNGGAFEPGAGVLSESTAVVSDCVITGNSTSYLGSGGGAFGGTLNNCVISSNSATFGGGVSGATLNNCDVHHNHVGGEGLGGGVVGSILKNCTLRENTAVKGGGAVDSVLDNCLVVNNSASQDGGGVAVFSTFGFGNLVSWKPNFPELNNCTITDNSAGREGGGVWSWSQPPGRYTSDGVRGSFPAKLSNCIVYNNNSPLGANHAGFLGVYGFSGTNYFGGQMSFSCTTPLPTNGFGNITNAPLFVDPGSGNFRLQSNSPCINSGWNTDAPAGLDLDGNPRIGGGTVDIGTYEFQSPQSTISYAWLQRYGFPMDGSADLTDPDGDGHNNWQEWRAWTDPTTSASALRLLTPLVSTNGLLIRWQSVSGQNYFLERGASLGRHHAFAPFASNIVSQADTTEYADTNAVGTGPFLYRIGVRD